MRVRTYGFPGCFTRPPGTSTRHHPHEPTTSKPVVPGDATATAAVYRRRTSHRQRARCEAPDARALRTKSDAVPSRLRNPSSVRPEGPSFRVARPHTSVASLFAARFRVWIQSSSRRHAIASPLDDRSRTFREKRRCDAAARRRRPHRGEPRDAAVRQRLAVLPQWRLWTIASVSLPAARRAGSARRPHRRCRPRRAPAHPGENPFGEPPRSAGAGAQPAQAHRQRARGDRRAGREVLAPRSKALLLLLPKLKLLDDGGHGARVGRGLLAVLRLDVRGRLRGAAVRARDGPRDRAAPRGHQGERADVHPLPRRRDHREVARRERARGGARRARRADPRHASARRRAWSIGEATNSDLLRALAYIGFFLNLFNLLPVVPLDGGRAMAAMAPWMWFVGLGALVALLFLDPATRSC